MNSEIPFQASVRTKGEKLKLISPIRVVHVATGAIPVASTGMGSTEQCVFYETKYLAQYGCRIWVIDVKANIPERRKTGVEFEEVWNPPIPNSGLWLYLRRFIFSFLSIVKLIRLVRKEKIDVIHTRNQFSAFPILVMRKLLRWHIPQVHTAHNHDIVMNPSLKSKIEHFQDFLVLKKADLIIAPTLAGKKQLISRFNIDPTRIAQIYHGVDLESIEEFKHKFPRKEVDKTFIILCVGIVTERKNQLRLVQSIPHILKVCSNVKFLFVGPIVNKHYFAKIHKFIVRNNLSSYVEFKGNVSKEELFSLYHNATLFALPTLRETQGLVFVEAMAFGLPIVASKIGPVKEVVEECALLINPYSVEEIAQAISLLLTNPSLRQKLSSKAQEKVKEFDWKEISKQLFLLYGALLNKRV